MYLEPKQKKTNILPTFSEKIGVREHYQPIFQWKLGKRYSKWSDHKLYKLGVK